MQLASSANAPLASMTLCWPGIDDMGPSINWPWRSNVGYEHSILVPVFRQKTERETHNMLVLHSPAHIIQWPPYRHSMVLPTPPPPPPFTSSNQDLQYQSHFEKLY